MMRIVIQYGILEDNSKREICVEPDEFFCSCTTKKKEFEIEEREKGQGTMKESGRKHGSTRSILGGFFFYEVSFTRVIFPFILSKHIPIQIDLKLVIIFGNFRPFEKRQYKNDLCPIIRFCFRGQSPEYNGFIKTIILSDHINLMGC